MVNIEKLKKQHVKGITFTALAKRHGVHRTTVMRWIRGKTIPRSILKLRRIQAKKRKTFRQKLNIHLESDIFSNKNKANLYLFKHKSFEITIRKLDEILIRIRKHKVRFKQIKLVVKNYKAKCPKGKIWIDSRSKGDTKTFFYSRSFAERLPASFILEEFYLDEVIHQIQNNAKEHFSNDFPCEPYEIQVIPLEIGFHEYQDRG